MALTTIGTASIDDNAITAAKIAADAVGSSEIAADAVGSSEIAADAVGTSEIATDAVASAEIAADAVGASELANDSVASANIIDGAIVNADVNASAALDATKIADGTVTSTEFQYINSLSSNAQTQLSARLPLAGGTMSGETIFADQIASRPVIKDYAETVYAGGNSSTSVTLAETNGNAQTFTMTGNCTFTMPSGAGLMPGASLTVICTQDGTGGRTATFTAVKWAGGTDPVLTSTATTGVDIITFYTFNGGASPVWYGFLSGADMS